MLTRKSHSKLGICKISNGVIQSYNWLCDVSFYINNVVGAKYPRPALLMRSNIIFYVKNVVGAKYPQPALLMTNLYKRIWLAMFRGVALSTTFFRLLNTNKRPYLRVLVQHHSDQHNVDNGCMNFLASSCYVCVPSSKLVKVDIFERIYINSCYPRWKPSYQKKTLWLEFIFSRKFRKG